MNRMMNTWLIIAILLGAGCQSRNKRVNITVHFPEASKFNQIGNKVYLNDAETREALDSTVISPESVAVFQFLRPSEPRLLAVRFQHQKGNDSLINLAGFTVPIREKYVFSFFYVFDKDTEFYHFSPDSTKVYPHFSGSDQNTPQFLTKGLKYDTTHDLNSDAIRYNLALIQKYPDSRYLLTQLARNKVHFDSAETDIMLRAFAPVINSYREYPELTAYLKTVKGFDKYYPSFHLETQERTKAPVLHTEKPYELLVFWASWCGPCRKEIPDLKKLYEKYGDKLAIAQVSIDKDTVAWRRAMTEEQMPWPQYLAGANQTEIDVRFDIPGIPKIYFYKDRSLLFTNFDVGPAYHQIIDSVLERK